MQKLMVLVMLMLTICTSAFAESVEDVLKDCKLDKNRWKVVEWFKEDNFVRFYDSKSVSYPGPGQFDAEICDYYYGATCRENNCKQVGTKHYHTEKWSFNPDKSTGTLRAFATKDANGNTVDFYNYPANMQIANQIKSKSIEGRTMLKVKDSLKGGKTSSSKGGDVISQLEEILKNEQAAMSVPIPDLRKPMPDYNKKIYPTRQEYQQYSDNFNRLIEIEEHILAETRNSDAKLAELEFTAGNSKKKELNDYKQKILQNRIAFVKKVSKGRLMGDPLIVGAGSTWQEIEMVYGTPTLIKTGGTWGYAYDGLTFKDIYTKGGLPPQGTKWWGTQAKEVELTNPKFTSDAGIKIGMTRAEVQTILRANYVHKSKVSKGLVFEKIANIDRDSVFHYSMQNTEFIFGMVCDYRNGRLIRYFESSLP